jgi:glycosyltransferase involved in cell wall biosynthesis
MDDLDPDVLVLQRPHELFDLAERWLGGRRPGDDVPAVYVEHNAPQGRINELRHPAADRRDLTVVHVTAFNQLFWDCGSTPTVLIEHGVVDPGHRYSGDIARAVAVINEPARRGRVTGTDLVERLAREAPIDLFGMGTEAVGFGNLPQRELHDAMSLRRVYLHPYRWTSLGLSLIEAMHLGLPVVALATTEVPQAVPPEAGIVTNRIDDVASGLRRLLAEPEEARVMGKAAREAALSRYGLNRFLADWDRVLGEVRR